MTNLSLVNKLVKKSFGRGFFGNHSPIIDPLCADQIRGNEVDGIAKRTWLPIPWLWENYVCAGQFTSKDGSSLEVFPNYINKAKEYGALYKKETGKDVLIGEMELSKEDLNCEIAEKIFNFKPNFLRSLFFGDKSLTLTKDQISTLLEEKGLSKYISVEEVINLGDSYISGGKSMGIKKVGKDRYAFNSYFSD